MRKLLLFITVLLASLFLYYLWWNRLPPFDGHDAPVDTPFSELHAGSKEVRVEGTAHHVGSFKRHYESGFMRPARDLWFWPLFPLNDTRSKLVTVVVASNTAPEKNVHYEDVTVEGFVRPPGARLGTAFEANLRKEGYRFDPAYILIEMFPPKD